MRLRIRHRSHLQLLQRRRDLCPLQRQTWSACLRLSSPFDTDAGVDRRARQLCRRLSTLLRTNSLNKAVKRIRKQRHSDHYFRARSKQGTASPVKHLNDRTAEGSKHTGLVRGLLPMASSRRIGLFEGEIFIPAFWLRLTHQVRIRCTLSLVNI